MSDEAVHAPVMGNTEFRGRSRSAHLDASSPGQRPEQMIEALTSMVLDFFTDDQALTTAILSTVQEKRRMRRL
jgi:hypothetical protein